VAVPESTARDMDH